MKKAPSNSKNKLTVKKKKQKLSAFMVWPITNSKNLDNKISNIIKQAQFKKEILLPKPPSRERETYIDEVVVMELHLAPDYFCHINTEHET